MKKLLPFVLLFLFIATPARAGFFDWINSFISPQLGASVFLPQQGGTGIGSATSSDVGDCIKVLDDSPFTYELGTCGSGITAINGFTNATQTITAGGILSVSTTSPNITSINLSTGTLNTEVSALGYVTSSIGGGGVATSSLGAYGVGNLSFFTDSSTISGSNSFLLSTSTGNFSAPTGTFSGRVMTPLVLGGTGSTSTLTLRGSSVSTASSTGFYFRENSFGQGQLLIGGDLDPFEAVTGLKLPQFFIVSNGEAAAFGVGAVFGGLTATDTNIPTSFVGLRARGSLANPTSTQDGDQIFAIRAQAWPLGPPRASITATQEGASGGRFDFSAGSALLTMRNSGFVGIGTQEPSSTLHVVGGRIRIQPTSNVGTPNEVYSPMGVVTTTFNSLGNDAGTETLLASTTIASNTITTVGDGWNFRAVGTFAGSATTDKRIKIILANNNLLGTNATTTIFDSGDLSITTSSDWSLEGYCVITGANTQKCSTNLYTALDNRTYTEYMPTTLTSTQRIVTYITGAGTDASDVVKELWRIGLELSP